MGELNSSNTWLEGLSEPNSAETEQTSDTDFAAQITHDIKSISQPRVA